MRIRTVLVLVFLAVLPAACASDDAPPSAADALDTLEQQSGARWRAVLRPDLRAVTFLSREDGTQSVDDDAPPPAVPATQALLDATPAAATRFLRSWPGLFASAAQADAVQVVGVTGDDLGGARARVRLYAGGLPLEGGDALVLVDSTGKARAAAGAFPAAPALAARPTLLRADAITIARAQVGSEAPGATLELEGEPELLATVVRGALRPMWRVVVRADQPARTPLLRREIHVDAATGAVLRERDGLWGTAVAGSGIGVDGRRKALEVATRSGGGYVLRDETRTPAGIRTFTADGDASLPGTLVASSSPDEWDEAGFAAGAAVDAHAYAGMTYDYLAGSLRRRSLDGRDGAIRLVVHYGDELVNAFWDGRRAVFGDGDEETAPLSGALDVVAHELFHGVTQHESGLIYEGESGALNESLSDVFACFVEWRKGDRDWTIGEDIASPPLRDLAHPSRTGNPSHMNEYVELPLTPAGDMGGVHENSTIPSHAAYLVAIGGTSQVSGVHVAGIGVTKTERIWYRAATLYLTPYASFADFAEATLAAAQDLYGVGSKPVDSVADAWRAVGVRP